MIEGLILTAIGALIGWFVSWSFAQSGRKDLVSVQAAMAESLEKLGKELGSNQRLLLEALAAMRSANPSESARIAHEASDSMGRVSEAIAKLPSYIGDSIRKEFTGSPCPRCGEPTYPSGMQADPSGALVYWYRCPVHGRFPGYDIADLADY